MVTICRDAGWIYVSVVQHAASKHVGTILKQHFALNSTVFVRLFLTSRGIHGNRSITPVLERKLSLLFLAGKYAVFSENLFTAFFLQMCHRNQLHPLHHLVLRNVNFQIIIILEFYQHEVINLSKPSLPSWSCCFCYLTIFLV